MPDTQESYCTAADLMFGNIPVPSDATTWCLRGAREIDSYIGTIYSTPVMLSDSVEQRSSKLLLQRINAFLATGRAIMALGGGGADDQNQQYGLYLVTQAEATLRAIQNGEIILPGADPATSSDTVVVTGPLIANVDESSFVEDFTAAYGNPLTTALNTQRYGYADGFYLTR